MFPAITRAESVFTEERHAMYTTQKQIRAAFWAAHPNFPRQKVPNYSGSGSMYVTDTRCAFSDFVDYLARDGQISEELAQRVTL